MSTTPPRPNKASDDNAHHRRTNLLRFRVVRADGHTMSGASTMAKAMETLAVLSRDGELDGFCIVARGVR